MTASGLLGHIFERLSRSDSGVEIFGADEAAEWPDGALNALSKAGLLRLAQPAMVIECDGCERNCVMQVYIRPGEDGRAARAFISCDKPEDMGRIPVELCRLKQWQITSATLMDAVVRLLGFSKPPQAEGTCRSWSLGLLEGKENIGTVTLSIENGITLAAGRQSIPLTHALTLDKRGLRADKG